MLDRFFVYAVGPLLRNISIAFELSELENAFTDASQRYKVAHRVESCLQRKHKLDQNSRVKVAYGIRFPLRSQQLVYVYL